MTIKASALGKLIRTDRIHGSLYTNPAIFDREIEHIWGRSWIYVGHESEIPDNGDYKRRMLGRQPVLMIRDSEGQTRVLHNRCRHRASLLCHRESGSQQRAFRCPYHGWTYSLKGELISPTFGAAYDAGLRKEEFALDSVARVDSYRGLVFASGAPEGPSLREHLGEAIEFLDLIFDRSPTGELDLCVGSQKMRYDGNWKMLPENSLEGAYHGHFIHKFAFDLADRRTGRRRTQMATDSVRYLRGGHMVEDFRYVTLPEPKNVPAHRAGYLARLEEVRGKERALELAPGRAPILFVFPNLMFVQTHFRRLQPVSANLTFVYTEPALFKGVDPAVNGDLLRSHESSFGPAGFLTPDDLEIMARSQIALGEGDEWLFIGRGLHRERLTERGGSIGHCMDENHLRGFWRHYREVMSG